MYWGDHVSWHTLENVCKLLQYLRPSRGIISLLRLKFSLLLVRKFWYLERDFFLFLAIIFLYVSVMIFYLAKEKGVQNNSFTPDDVFFFTLVTCIYTLKYIYLYSFMHIFISIEIYKLYWLFKYIRRNLATAVNI